MALEDLPNSGSESFETNVRGTLHTWKDSIEEKAGSSHTHGSGGGVSLTLVSREANLGTGATSGELSATTLEYNNMYAWDGPGELWQPFSGNYYSSVSLPTHGTYQNVTGQTAYDLTQEVRKEWRGVGTLSWVTAPGFYNAYVRFADEKNYTVGGGTFSKKAWRIRDLNTATDQQGVATLESEASMGLATGTWRVRVDAPSTGAGTHACCLYDLTAGSTIFYGTPGRGANNAHNESSRISGRFVLGSASSLQVRHFCGTGVADYGFGSGSSIVDVSNIYTVAEFWRES